MNTDNPIRIAIAQAGNASRLAKGLGVTVNAVLKWQARWDAGRVDAVPPNRALEIEGLLGMPRAQLRPDLWGDASAPCCAAA